MNPKQIVKLSIAAIIFLAAIITTFQMIVDVDAREIVIVHLPFSGKLTVYNTAGWKYQGFGSVTRYHKSFQYNFSSPRYIKDQDEDQDKSIKVRFNDGGHAQFSGSVRIDLPTDEKNMLNLHTRFGSQGSIENDLIDKTIIKAVYMSSPLMSSKESYAEKRNDLINYVSDQAENGVYKTYQKEVRQKDPISGEERTVTVVEYQRDSMGHFLRQDISPLQQLSIGFTNLSILSLDYDSTVEAQIKSQQALTMQVQTAIATAKQAEQQAITTVKQGEANAAKTKWEQEAIKAQKVTEAEQERDVANLSAQKEEFNKRANILKGEGEAQYKRLVTQANDNLEIRLNAWIEINKAYASAMSESTWVPTYVFGGGGGANNSMGAQQLIDLLTAKTAKDLQLGNVVK
jgi:hypothetical protein